MNRPRLSRRAVLRGAGVTMSLPWLESVPAWGEQPARGAARPPVRLAVLFSGNGYHRTEWSARGEGRGLELGKVLQPLRDFREKLTFIRGLYNAEALKGNIHSSQTGNLLSGAPLASGGEIRSGTSFDQVISQRYGAGARVPSLVLGCERSNPGIHKNYSMLYSSHISWSSPTSPTPLELYPALAFDRLFKDQAERGDQSVLDAVLSEANRLRKSISASDRRKLDDYLGSVREVEQRIQQAGRRGEFQGTRPASQPPPAKRPPDGIPQDLPEHMRLMCDILVLAFQTDATRVCTLKLNNDHSYLRFPFLGVDVGHHELSHQGNDDWMRVNRFFAEQLGYIAGRLDAIREGERSVLDNSILMMCSSMLTGGHEANSLPVVLLGGGGGGTLKGGRVLDYTGRPNRKMCSLFLSLMDRYDVRLTEFGDSKERLDEI